jgi:hypothetical protein
MTPTSRPLLAEHALQSRIFPQNPKNHHFNFGLNMLKR